MPVSSQQYDIAKAGLQAAVDDPDAFSAEEFERLNAIVREYQDESIKVDKPTNYGEGGSLLLGDMAYGDVGGRGASLQTQGMGVLEKNITSPETHAQREKARAASPKIAQGLNLDGALPMPAIPDETESERNERRKNYEKEYFDRNLPAASGRKDLFAPPELHAPSPVTNPVDAFGANMEQASSHLPAYMGGKVEHYLEPPVTQFHREMYPVLGERVFTLGIGDDEYGEYADQLWKKIYDQAKAEGRSVVRTRYAQSTDWKDKAFGVGAEAIGALAGAARAADAAGFFGVGSRVAGALGGDVENYKRLAEGSPIASTIGSVIGGASPIGAGGLVTKGLGKLIPEAAGYAGAALRGGAIAAGSGAASTASMAAAEDRLPSGGELALGAGLGLPFGLLGGAHGKQLRGSTPLGVVEKTGMGETDALWGVRSSPRARAVEEASFKSTGQRGREVDFLKNRLEKPMSDAGRMLQVETERDLGAAKDAFYADKAGRRKPLGALVRDAVELRKGMATPDGRIIPKKEGNARFLDKLIVESTEAEIVPATEGGPLARGKPGSMDITANEAEAMGIDVNRKMESYLALGNEPPGEFVVRMNPRELNAQEMEKLTKQIDLELRMGDNPQREEMNKLLRSTREVRDQFGGGMGVPSDLKATVNSGAVEGVPGYPAKTELTGLSAFERKASERTGAVKRTLEMAGLPEKVPETLDAGQAQKFQNTIGGYQQPGRPIDVDKALETLAALGNQQELLDAVPGMTGLKELQRNASMPNRVGLTTGARLRLDAMLPFLGPGMGAAAPGAYKRFSGARPDNLPAQMTPEELEEHRKQMGIWGPFGPP